MKTRAPGKLVVSGAYAVLDGAASIVTAVNRYAIADTEVAPDFVSPELREALDGTPAPHVDVKALRNGERKLGIGSSAAIVVAGVGAVRLAQRTATSMDSLRKEVFEVARAAHRKVQGGGSGIDVAASSFGGTLHCRLCSGQLHVQKGELPGGLQVKVHVASHAASTPQMIEKVNKLKGQAPQVYARIMGALCEASEETAVASRAADFVKALRKQAILLSELGDCASAPIFPLELRPVADAAIADGVVVMPSGAGGGDITLCIGLGEACEAWRQRIEAIGQMRLDVEIGAEGLQQVN